jgi:antirestriction protein
MSNDSAPMIYIASLSDYNDGRLHGAWIRADQTRDELYEATQKMLNRSPFAGAEEWAIHDYEGFGSIRLSEFANMETIARLASGIVEYGLAYAALVEVVGTEAEGVLGRFEDFFRGRYSSMAEFAEQFADDLGWPEQLDRLDEGPRAYASIDYESFGRDLSTELDAVEADGGGIYVFDIRS